MVSVEVFPFTVKARLKDSYLSLDNEIDRKIDVTAIQYLLVQNRQQIHDWTLIGSGANGIDIQVWGKVVGISITLEFRS